MKQNWLVCRPGTFGRESFRDFLETGTWLHVSNVIGDEYFLTASLDFNGNSIRL